MSKAKLKFLGRGSAFNPKEGNTSAYLKNEKGNVMILLDCGSTVFERIIKYNVLNGVRYLYVFITHTHQDHIGSLSTLIEYCHFVLNISVKVYIPTKNFEFNYKVNRDYMFYFLSGMGEYDNTELIYYNYEKRITICMDKSLPIFIHTFIANHKVRIKSDGFYIRSRDFESFSFVLRRLDGDTIIYTGDTKEPNISMISQFPDADIYVDAAIRTHSNGNEYPHFSIHKLYQFCKEHDIDTNRVYLMHLDCDGVEEEGKRLGFNVVENITEDTV